MGYNLTDYVIKETPDKKYYSSGVFISRERIVWVHALKKFIPFECVSMHVNCILVKDQGHSLIFNHFEDFLAKSNSVVTVNEDGYVILQDPTRHVLENPDGKNLYEQSYWHLIPFMGGKIEIPHGEIKESLYLKTSTGKTIVELADSVYVEIYSKGVVINDHWRFSYIDTQSHPYKTIVNDADGISVYADSTLFIRKDKSFYHVKLP